MASDEDWGVLVEHDEDMADAWDTTYALPEPGTNPVLDAFVASKNLTIPSLVRVGARLQSETTLAFAYPGGLKFRDMESGTRWNWVGSDFTALKIVKAATPSSTVIVAEGETDGAWLASNYDADVALLPVGARGIKAAYAEQLLQYDRVLVGTDDDSAGEDGWKKILALVPYAQRFQPPGGCKDWCEAGALVPELPEGTSLDRVGKIIFEDLTAAYNKQLPAPVVIVDDLLYDQGVHWLSAHPDSGKSIMAMHMAWEVMTQGRHVVWLDYEQGKRMTGQRLSEMGVPLDLVSEFFHWAWYPVGAEDELALVSDTYPGALVVVDSVSKALAQSGIGENENTEVLAWTIKIIQASKQYSLPVLVIDHVTKNDKDSDYARGAGTKQADTDVHWKVDKLEDFTRAKQGLIQMTRHKDREGYLPKRVFFKVGDGAGGLGVLPTDGPDADEGEGLPSI